MGYMKSGTLEVLCYFPLFLKCMKLQVEVGELLRAVEDVQWHSLNATK